MEISSSIGFKNYISQNILTNNNSSKSNLHLKSQSAKDTVEFTGAAKYLSNVYDKAFVNILEQDLELTKEAGVKLKNLVWDFLRKHKVESLGELGGEEFFDEQVELQEQIMKKLNLPDDVSEFVAREIINRCDEGEKYIPGGLNAFAKDKELEQHLMNLDGVKYLKGVLAEQADQEFYEYARKALRLSPEENYEFRITIENYLKENNLKSITDLAGDDMLNEQAELTELLGKKFDLSDAETSAIQWELISRANSGEEYRAIANEFVKDAAPLEALVKRGGYDYIIEGALINKEFSDGLFQVMSNEAEAHGYKNIFEIFLKENNPNKSKTFKYIQNSQLSADQKANIILDLSKAAREPEEFAKTAPKHVEFDNFYGSIYTDMITEKIMIRYDIPKIIQNDIKEIIERLQPSHVRGGEDCRIEQVAFEIADKYNLPVKAEKDIISIITEVLNGGTKKADIYIMEKIMSRK